MDCDLTINVDNNMRLFPPRSGFSRLMFVDDVFFLLITFVYI